MMTTALTALNKRLILLEQKLDNTTDQNDVHKILDELAEIECDLDELGGIDE